MKTGFGVFFSVTMHSGTREQHVQWRGRRSCDLQHNAVIISAMASQITGVTIDHSTVCSGADQRKYQSSASVAFVRGIHRWPVTSLHKWPVTRKLFSFDDVIMGRSVRTCPRALWQENPPEPVAIPQCIYQIQCWFTISLSLAGAPGTYSVNRDELNHPSTQSMDNIHTKLLGEIDHPWYNFNSGLTKHLLKLEHEWVITLQRIHWCNY